MPAAGGRAMSFNRLTISEWQQFRNVELDFHDRLTILTGANGSGKTTILNLLARHCGWSVSSLATPKRDLATGVVRFLTRLFNGRDRSQQRDIGEIQYGSGERCVLRVPESSPAQYQVEMSGQTAVKCFYVPSHGSVFRYQAIQNIPMGRKDKTAAFQEVANSTRNAYMGGGGDSGSFHMKNTLIGWIIQGYGVSGPSKPVMPGDGELVKFYEGFQEVLKKVLPRTLGFEEMEIGGMEIVFVCNGGKDEFVLETASGGISSLISMAWQIYMFSTAENPDFTILIDEVENHLHPTMQRHVLPDLLAAFPEARFIVATHSPLVIGSAKASKVYALRYDDENKVVSEGLDFRAYPRSAAEVLDEVLGVSFTMPIWVEESLMSIVNKYSGVAMDDAAFGRLRDDLAGLGLERLMPRAIGEIVEDR
jgi:hypothetical protein